MTDLIFLKLGGSLITDKRSEERLRPDVLARLAAEVATARAVRPEMRLVVGHGSGSFGHVPAARHNTRAGVNGAEAWAGFAEVSAAAARLNRHVTQAFLEAGVPALSLQPSASAVCADGALVEMATAPIHHALEAGLVPLVYGDVAVDRALGGTIISTEQVLAFLARLFKPGWLLLAGDTEGVLDAQGEIIPRIDASNRGDLAPVLGGSGGVDVTGGMAGKVEAMLELAAALPGTRIRIVSGLVPGRLHSTLHDPAAAAGTEIGATGQADRAAY
jgi:isopentenyl phosphate kinase